VDKGEDGMDEAIEKLKESFIKTRESKKLAEQSMILAKGAERCAQIMKEMSENLRRL
jgi:hypothetical protein